MMTAAAKKTTTRREEDEVSSTATFGGALLDIGWRLAGTVIVFLWGGSWLDKKFDTKPLFVVIGFGLVIASFVLIVRGVLRTIPKDQGGLGDS